MLGNMQRLFGTRQTEIVLVLSKALAYKSLSSLFDFTNKAVGEVLQPLSAMSRRTLARTLRQHFTRRLSPTILAVVSDEDLLRHYEAELEYKEKDAFQKTVSNVCRIAVHLQKL